MRKILFVILLGVLAIGLWWSFGQDTENLGSEQTNQTSTSSDTNATPPGHIMATDPKSGISFTYPTTVEYQYLTLQNWPPRFVHTTDPGDCVLDEGTQAMSGATTTTGTINGNSYCISLTHEGAAGSVYTTYQLTYQKDEQYIAMSFVVRYPQCENYPTEFLSECEAEQRTFPLNDMIDTIAQSIQLP